MRATYFLLPMFVFIFFQESLRPFCFSFLFFPFRFLPRHSFHSPPTICMQSVPISPCCFLPPPIFAPHLSALLSPLCSVTSFFSHFPNLLPPLVIPYIPPTERRPILPFFFLPRFSYFSNKKILTSVTPTLKQQPVLTFVCFLNSPTH